MAIVNESMTGLYYPDEVIQDVTAFETANKTGRITGGAIAAMDSLMRAPFVDFINTTKIELSKHLDPGKLLGQEEWEKSPWFREGLSFSELAGSTNTLGDDTAKIASQRFDQTQFRQALLANMDSGFLSGASKFVGQNIGFVLDPINGATLSLAETFIGAKSALLLGRLNQSGRLTRTLARVGLGAVEGGAIFAPQSFAEFETDKIFGQDPSSFAILASIGLGAALGGAIRGAFGFRNVITHDAYNTARQTAAGQLATGKSVHVDEILQYGYREERFKETGVLRETTTQVKDDLKDLLTKNESELGNIEQDLLEEVQRQKIEDIPIQRGKVKLPVKAKDVLTRLKTIREKPGFLRTAREKVFLDKITLTDELAKGLDILEKPGFTRTTQERLFLRLLLEGGEERLIQSRLAGHDREIKSLKEELGRTEVTQTEQVAELQEKLNAFENKRDIGKVRLNEITGKKIEGPRVKEVRQKVDTLKKNKELLKQLIDDHEVALKMDNSTGETISFSKLKGVSDKIASFKGDSVYNQTADNLFTRELERIKDDPVTDLSELQSRVDQLREQDLLTKEEIESLDFEEIDKSLSTISNAIRLGANCLKGAP